ncbi:MAG: hypothetical protein FWG66_08005 [Spirochaetes bacterium]|nr:hypothetical protein [Spirochaetota bacterium]
MDFSFVFFCLTALKMLPASIVRAPIAAPFGPPAIIIAPPAKFAITVLRRGSLSSDLVSLLKSRLLALSWLCAMSSRFSAEVP